MFYHNSNLVPSQQKNPQDPQQDKAANASQLVTFLELPTSLPSFQKKNGHLLGPLQNTRPPAKDEGNASQGTKEVEGLCKVMDQNLSTSQKIGELSSKVLEGQPLMMANSPQTLA